MSPITPNIWCQRNADEAATFYTRIFATGPGGSRILSTERYPEENLPDFQQPLAGETLSIDLELGGQRFILINAGEEFRPGTALGFMLNFDPLRDPAARAGIDSFWSQLSAGGEVLLPLGEYPYSSRYGMLRDRYGVCWQLILTDPEGEPRPFVIPVLTFAGPVQNQAVAAQEEYVRIFPDSRTGMRALYGEPTGPASAEAVMFSEFTLDGQWMIAMDSGVEQAETFSEGVSLMYEVHGQAELDRIWAALSADPAAEQCGWLKDRFGVSWQIIPDNLGELMTRHGAYQKLLGMGRIIIGDF